MNLPNKVFGLYDPLLSRLLFTTFLARLFQNQMSSSPQEHEARIARIVRKAVDAPEAKYFRVHRNNEQYLVHALLSRPHLAQSVLDYSDKQSYYKHKLYKLLHENAPDTRVSSSSTLLLNPSYICNRHLALSYLKHHILGKPSCKVQLRRLVEKHASAQHAWRKSRAQLATKYDEQKSAAQREIQRKAEGYHPSKMQKMLQEFTDTKLHKIADELLHALAQFDLYVYRSCRTMSTDLAKTLKAMRIPFFCTDEAYCYPELQRDQEFVLDKIQELVSDRSDG